MPALIEDNMLAWKGEKPWHGLGFEVPALATGEEMLKISKLDWPVQRRSIAMRTADGKSTLTAQLKGFKAIVRGDNDYVFQVATDKYFPVQNAEIVSFFREYCEAGSATMETVGGLKGGAIIWALAKLNHGTTVKIGGVDELKGYLLLATSHDGSVRTIGKATQIRVVCANTLMCAFGEHSKQEFKMKHTRKWTPEVAAEAKVVMGMAVEQVIQANELAEQFSKIKIDLKGQTEFVKRLLAKPVLVPVLNEPEAKDGLSRTGKAIMESINTSPGADLPTAKWTVWGTINGITAYVDHQQGRVQDNRVHGALFATGTANIKVQAVNLAAEMAGIKVR